MKWIPTEFPVPVAHLCPSITKVAKLFRRHTESGDPDRKEALKLLREIQHGVHQLRHNDTLRQLELKRRPGATLAMPAAVFCINPDCSTIPVGSSRVVKFDVASGTQDGIPEKHHIGPGVWLICLGCGVSWRESYPG